MQWPSARVSACIPIAFRENCDICRGSENKAVKRLAGESQQEREGFGKTATLGNGITSRKENNSGPDLDLQ